MLTREGTSRGNEPTVQVLEIAANQQRKADDLLPYLSPFAQFYRSLPKNPKELILKRALIPLNDIECLTRTVIDIPEGVENLFKKKGNDILVTHYIDQANLSGRCPQASPGPVPASMPIVELRGLG